MRRLIVFWIISAIIMASGLVATVVLCQELIRGERAELRSTTQAHAERIGAQLQTGVLAALQPLERLGRWWLTQGRPMDPEDWTADGQLFMSQSPGLRKAIWVGVNGRPQWSAVPGGVPETTAARAEDPVLRRIAAPRACRQVTISEVFYAPAIGPAFYTCFAVGRGGPPQGYIVGLFDASALVSAIAGGASLRGHRIVVEAGGRLIYASGSVAGNAEEKASAPVRFGDRLWTVELHVPLNYFRQFQGLILTMFTVIAALGYSSCMLLAFSLRRSTSLQRANSALTSEIERRVRSETEIRGLNRDLSRKIADFETLLDLIPIGIAVAEDPECRNIRANRALARMLGVPPAANISMTAADPASPPYRMIRNGRDLSPDELPMQVAAATGKPVIGVEDQIVRRDGAVLDVLSFASPVLDENGRVRGVLNACVDLSERKRLERRLHRDERMKSLGGMAAGIAHDFNNLLTGILGRASLAVEFVSKESEALGHIEACMDAAQQASSLVHKVLAFTGTSYHTLRPVNLGRTVERVQMSLSAIAAPKAILRFAIAPGLPEVMADAGEVRQALRNLVVNAVEATPSAGADIGIRVDRCSLSGAEPQLTFLQEKFQPGDYVRVEVTDSGPGMPPEIAEKAFDPFFSTKFVGRGLGLSEVLGIMRAHNGAVRLAAPRGGGTSVELFFPIPESNHATQSEAA